MKDVRHRQCEDVARLTVIGAAGVVTRVVLDIPEIIGESCGVLELAVRINVVVIETAEGPDRILEPLVRDQRAPQDHAVIATELAGRSSGCVIIPRKGAIALQAEVGRLEGALSEGIEERVVERAVEPVRSASTRPGDLALDIVCNYNRCQRTGGGLRAIVVIMQRLAMRSGHKVPRRDARIARSIGLVMTRLDPIALTPPIRTPAS